MPLTHPARTSSQSAITIRSDQLFRGLGPEQWLVIAPTHRYASQGGTPGLARITPNKLLKIVERLLSETALMRPRPPLQQLMQGLREIPNLQGCTGGETYRLKRY